MCKNVCLVTDVRVVKFATCYSIRFFFLLHSFSPETIAATPQAQILREKARGKFMFFVFVAAWKLTLVSFCF